MDERFNTVLCCYLNILYWKKKTYVPAAVLIPALAAKLFNDVTSKGRSRAFSHLKRSADYVHQVTKGWTLHSCGHCGDDFELKSWYFVRKEVRLRCKKLCINCNSIATSCLQCNNRCTCCWQKDDTFMEFFRLYPQVLISHCAKNNSYFFGEMNIQGRCCSKYYKYLDEASKIFWQQRCDVCNDRVECLLTRD